MNELSWTSEDVVSKFELIKWHLYTKKKKKNHMHSRWLLLILPAKRKPQLSDFLGVWHCAYLPYNPLSGPPLHPTRTSPPAQSPAQPDTLCMTPPCYRMLFLSAFSGPSLTLFKKVMDWRFVSSPQRTSLKKLQ